MDAWGLGYDEIMRMPVQRRIRAQKWRSVRDEKMAAKMKSGSDGPVFFDDFDIAEIWGRNRIWANVEENEEEEDDEEAC